MNCVIGVLIGFGAFFGAIVLFMVMLRFLIWFGRRYPDHWLNGSSAG